MKKAKTAKESTRF